MRICVITFFNNGNYGSELQAMAMNSFLKHYGHDVTFCKVKYSNKVVRVLEIIRDRIITMCHRLLSSEYNGIWKARLNNLSNQRTISDDLRKHISAFMREQIITITLSPHELRTSKDFDCYICGSDQIWSASTLPVSKWRFLVGIPTSKKIAYAPSFGLNVWPTYFLKAVKSWVDDFRYLSVRETNASENIFNLIGRRPPVVLDPTLLVGKSYWEKFSGHKRNSYCLCYFLGNIPNEIINYVNDHYHNDVIVLPYEDQCRYFLHGKFVNANPEEFINLVMNADFVFTDSFHGTVFSILFERPFIVLNRTHNPKLSQTSRINSLLDILELQNRKLDDLQAIEKIAILPINYAQTNSLLEQYRMASKSFLESSLSEIQKSQ